jgi:Ca2+-binding EF-hand superfamily protein
MHRWTLLLLAALVGLLPAADEGKPATKDDKKAKARPLVDIDAFLAEYDRDKDGFLSKEELPEWLHHAFARLDTNKDGKISKDELREGMALLQPRRRPSDLMMVLVEMSDCDEGCGEEVQRAYEFLRKLDKNNDGKLDADELKAGREMVINERVGAILRRLDADKDGKISKKEARGMVKDHFDELDKNKDGFVDKEELLAAARAKHADEKRDPAPKEK